MADYPDSIYTPRAVENEAGVVYDPDALTTEFAEDKTLSDDEIVAIQETLGTNPEGVYATVKAWLTALAAAVATIVTDFISLDDTPSSYSGEAGKVVAVNDSEDALEFIDAPVGDASIELIASGSFPSANYLDITDIPSKYRYLILQADGYSCTFSNRHIQVLYSTNNGSSFDTSHSGSCATDKNDTYDGTLFTSYNNQSSGNTGGFIMYLFGYQGGAFPYAVGFAYQAGVTSYPIFGFAFDGSNPINALRIRWSSSGNFDAGTYALYGVL